MNDILSNDSKVNDNVTLTLILKIAVFNVAVSGGRGCIHVSQTHFVFLSWL